jgi:hypothetical protein
MCCSLKCMLTMLSCCLQELYVCLQVWRPRCAGGTLFPKQSEDVNSFYLGFVTAPRDSRYWPCKIAFADFRPINRFCGFMKHWASRGQVTLGHFGGIKEVVACGTTSVAHGSHFTEQRRRCQSRPLLVGGTGGQSLLVTACKIAFADLNL